MGPNGEQDFVKEEATYMTARDAYEMRMAAIKQATQDYADGKGQYNMDGLKRMKEAAEARYKADTLREELDAKEALRSGGPKTQEDYANELLYAELARSADHAELGLAVYEYANGIEFSAILGYRGERSMQTLVDQMNEMNEAYEDRRAIVKDDMIKDAQASLEPMLTDILGDNESGKNVGDLLVELDAKMARLESDFAEMTINAKEGAHEGWSKTLEGMSERASFANLERDADIAEAKVLIEDIVDERTDKTVNDVTKLLDDSEDEYNGRVKDIESDLHDYLNDEEPDTLSSAVADYEPEPEVLVEAEPEHEHMYGYKEDGTCEEITTGCPACAAEAEGLDI